MQRRAVLALFAKQPSPGQVKTRLCPPLSPEQAASFYCAMLLDILDQHRHEPDVDLALWFSPADALPWFERHAPAEYRLHAQDGPDLACRMQALFHRHAEQGYERILLRGTDSPTLPGDRIAQALRALDHADLVLCPDRDGGYNLIGLCKPADPLFDLEMSNASVMQGTLHRARDLGMRVRILVPHHDVDTIDDVARVARELPDPRLPRTSRWVREADLGRVRLQP